MQNSAILRIKNQLAYRLGSTMIEHRANGGGYLSLIYKLYKIKKEYTKEQKLYKQTIKLFPQLTYPRLETCYDYNESIKYKFHLSYMLGLVLINADKNKFKGGYFTLFKDIKKAKKDYKNINSMLKEFNIISSNMYNIIANNKDKFINNFNEIQKILHTHKDYQVIIDNIFHNFDYFLNNFELIKEWLTSDDFYQKYKKENHPYPSLLDPKKLNDENEQINYHNIPAELAWEMNLPLPNRYKFIIFTFGLTGHTAMLYTFISYGITFQPYSEDYKGLYIDNLNVKYDCLSILYGTEKEFIKSIKYLHLLPDIDVLILTRDPISKLKSGLNHGWTKRKDCYADSEMSIEQILDGVDYAFMTEDVEACYLTMEYMLNKWLDNHIWRYNAITNCLVSDNILYLDMEDIMPDKIIDTFETLRKRFDFKETPNADIQCTAFGDWRYIIPLIVNFKSYDIAIHIDPKQHLSCDNVDLNIIFDKKHKLLNDVSFSVSRLDYEKICKNDFIIKELSSFEDIFLEELNKKIIDIKNKKYTEMDILRYIKEDSDIRTKMLNLFTEEFIHIKQHRPDIVASWKYYQEFEKMCEELDGKKDSLKENISNN